MSTGLFGQYGAHWSGSGELVRIGLIVNLGILNLRFRILESVSSENLNHYETIVYFLKTCSYFFKLQASFHSRKKLKFSISTAGDLQDRQLAVIPHHRWRIFREYSMFASISCLEYFMIQSSYQQCRFSVDSTLFNAIAQTDQANGSLWHTGDYSSSLLPLS